MSGTTRSFTCAKCDATFDTKNKLDRHVADFHRESYALKISNESTVVIQRDKATGHFFCPNELCTRAKGFPRADSLARHYKKVHYENSNSTTSWSSTLNAAKKKKCITSPGELSIILPFDESDTPTLLLPTNLRYAKVHSPDGAEVVFLVCKKCNHVLSPDFAFVKNHLNRHAVEFPQTKPESDGNGGELDKVRSFCMPSDESLSFIFSSSTITDHDTPSAMTWLDPYHHTTSNVPVEPVPGVPIQNGFQCVECMKCFKSESTMRKHINQHSPKSSYLPVYVQGLLPCIGRHFVRVLYNEDLPVLSSVVAEEILANEEAIRRLGNSELPSHRERNAWLRVSGWPEFAEAIIPKGVSYKQISDCFDGSAEDGGTCSELREIVGQYMDAFKNVCGSVHVRFRRLVMGHDESGQIPTRGLRVHTCKSTTAKYCEYMFVFFNRMLNENPLLGCEELKLLGNFSEHQLECCHELQRVIRDSESDRLTKMVSFHQLLLSLWTMADDGEVHVASQSDSFVLRFLLLTSLQQSFTKEDGYAFQNVTHVTGRCAIFFYWIRATILMEIGRPFWDDDSKTRNFPSERLKELLQSVEDNASASPYSQVRDLKRLASTVTDGEHSADVLQIVGDDGRRALQNGNLLGIDDVSAMLRRMRDDLTDTLRGHVLFGLETRWLTEFLSIPKRELADDLRCDHVGYNFVEANVILSNHRQDLIRHLFQSCLGQSRFIKGRMTDGRVVYDHDALLEWLQCGDQCFLDFAKANHLSSGEPMRGDEYSSLNIINTETGERSFVWLQSEQSIVVWQTYNKTVGRGAAVKHIARVVAPDWLELFFLLEVVVRPALTHVAFILWPDETMRAYKYKSNWLVRCGHSVTGRQFGTSLCNTFVDHVGFPVGLAQWRHWAVFFGDYVKKHHGVGQVTLPLDEQAGHSELIASKRYATTTSDIRGLDRNKLAGFCAASRAWHSVFRCNQSMVASIDADPTPECTDSNKSVRLPNTNIHVALPECLNVPTITEIHHYLHVEKVAEGPGNTVVAANQYPMPPRDSSCMIAAKQAMTTLGFSSWRCDQQALAASIIVENRRDLGVILPTGCGKSALFHIPTILFPTKCVVVIVFLAELRTAHLLEAQKAGIEASIYDGAHRIGECPPSLLILGPEQAAQESFREYMSALVALNKLFAIFFDEAHLLLESYRDVMTRLSPLSAIRIPFVVTTATLEPGEESVIQVRLSRFFSWIRMPTVRPNVGYCVAWSDDINRQIYNELYTWQANRIDARERALIYCFTRQVVETTHDILQRAGFRVCLGHSGIERTENLQRRLDFESGVFNIMITSPLLGCGYNYRYITLVLHHTMARSLKDYAQQSGRAGRAGQKSVALIVTNGKSIDAIVGQVAHSNHDQNETHRLRQMVDYVTNNETCRRWILHKAMDGRPSHCLLVSGGTCELCDVCKVHERKLPLVQGQCQKGRGPDDAMMMASKQVDDESVGTCNNMELSEIDDDNNFSTTQTIGRVTTESIPNKGWDDERNRPAQSPASESATIISLYKKARHKETAPQNADTEAAAMAKSDHQGTIQCTALLPMFTTTNNISVATNPSFKVLAMSAFTGEAFSCPLEGVVDNSKEVNQAKQWARMVQEMVLVTDCCLTCHVLSGRRQFCRSIWNCPSIPIMDGQCCNCLGYHDRAKCPNVQIPRDNTSCTVCGLCIRSIGLKGESAVDPHFGKYGSYCAHHRNGDKMRLIVWKYYRTESKLIELSRSLPELRQLQREDDFAKMLYQKPPDKPVTLFYKILGEIARKLYG